MSAPTAEEINPAGLAPNTPNALISSSLLGPNNPNPGFIGLAPVTAPRKPPLKSAKRMTDITIIF